MDDVVCVESTDSTNSLARIYANDGAHHGFTIMAGQQTAGRGRLGKRWYSSSPLGLYCTIVLRPDLPAEEFSRITLAAGLAVCRAIEKLYLLQISLKWPNDIYVAGKKCGGILVEGTAQPADDSQLFVLVGIGVNINQSKDAFPEEIATTATSLSLESGKVLAPEILVRDIREHLLYEVQRLERGEFQDMLNDWRGRDMLFGRWMNWVTATGEVVHGKSLGVNDSGELLVVDSSGSLHEVISGDVSLAVK